MKTFEEMTLDDLMKCPVDWEKKLDFDGWQLSLPQLDWYYSFAQRAVDPTDISLYLCDFDVISENDDQLKRLKRNLYDRRSAAVTLYMTRAGRLHGIRFMTPSEHGKHYAAGMTEENALQESSRKGISFFFKNCNGSALERGFWNWLCLEFQNVNNYEEYEEFLDPKEKRFQSPQAALWQRLLSETCLRICMNTPAPVGACDGRPTSFLCYDLHIDNRIAHCFPISEAEAERIMGDLETHENDSLNC